MGAGLLNGLDRIKRFFGKMYRHMRKDVEISGLAMRAIRELASQDARC